MAIFRNADTITLSMLDFLRIVQPDLDTKPGTVARELFVDIHANELAKLYIELRNVSNLQSLATARGSDLARLAKNFGQVAGTGANATGVAVMTAASLESDIPIPVNSLVGANNGFSYRVLSTTTMFAANASVYRANAIRLQADLELAGIQDEFAVEVAVEATSAGAGGNIGKFGLTTHSIAGISNITNLQSFTGGTSAETDDAFRSRVLAIFAGSNTGTALGYINALLKDPRIQDVLTVEPGDPLMLRDGTDVSTNDAGETIVISAGTGGKVDIYIQGAANEQFVESFIYRDQSGKNDPTDERNDFVLGQRGVNSELDFQQRRRLALSSGLIPLQPVDAIISVSGSLSGPNFTEKSVDENGQTIGSFELIKDTGAFGGSPFGFDTLHFISGTIKLTDEALGKGQLNSQDALDFTSVSEISAIRQSISVLNESPTVDAGDRSLLSLAHYPISSVDRIINLTTGERYSVNELNPNGSGGIQSDDGVIRISAKTLPTTTDSLQVNYVWEAQYDSVLDFDDLTSESRFKTVQDSVDWGFSNRIAEERHTVSYSVADGYQITLDWPATKIINVNTIVSESKSAAGGKIEVEQLIENILDVRDGYGREVFNTKAADGSFSGRSITLPTDTLLQNGETATVRYNVTDVYSPDGYEIGTFAGQLVTLPIDSVSPGQVVFADYVAALEQIIPTTALADLPATGEENHFVIDGADTGYQPVLNKWTAGSISSNTRFAPSFLKINLQGIPSRGRLAISGTSFTKIETIHTVTQTSLTIDFSNSIKEGLGITSIPTTTMIAMVEKIERVTLTEGLVSSIDHEFDLLNYEISNTNYSNGTSIEDEDLSGSQVKLQATEENLDNIPTVGEKLRIVIYVANSIQTETIPFTSSGILFSKHKYVFVDSISISSGFTSLAGVISGTIAVSSINQPASGSQYFATYDYVAPKEGERITVAYNYNRLIADSTIAIEQVRPITGDVLVKAAAEVALDLELQVVLAAGFENNETVISQNLTDALTTFISGGGLEATIDASDIIQTAYSVDGVDRIVITKFNLAGSTGILKSISAGRNQFFAVNSLIVEVEDR